MSKTGRFETAGESSRFARVQEPFAITSTQVWLGSHTQQVQPCVLVINNHRVEAIYSPAEFAQSPHAHLFVKDYGTAFICPGFHDAHQHVFHAALFPSKLALEYCGTSEQDLVARLQEFATTHPGTGWLVAHGWRENLWDVPVPPTRASLDKAFPTRPVACYSGDAHTLWVNTCGLERLGITNNTKAPAGGTFDRDAKGDLTGVLREAAGMFYVARVLRDLPFSDICELYEDYFLRLNSMGITSVCDMALSLVPGADGINARVYQELLHRGNLTVRAHLFPTLTQDTSNLQELQRLCGCSSMLQAPGFKQFFDGVSSQHTAWVSEPYTNARSEGDVGRPTVEPDVMHDLVMRAAAQKQGVRIHTIGDRAVHEALNIFEEAIATYGNPAHGMFTLEHVEDIAPQDLPRFAELGVVASVQPPHVLIDTTQPARDLGEERAARMWPFAELLASGAVLALGTDAPVVGPSSQDVLWCACMRSDPKTHEPQGGWYPQHRLSRFQALAAYTKGSATAVGRAHELGSLDVGQYADFAVWDTNLMDETQDLQQAQVLACYVGGLCTWEQKPSAIDKIV